MFVNVDYSVLHCICQDENALNRVASLPMVASTWNALQNYYAGMKKKYPGVSPYLEVSIVKISGFLSLLAANSCVCLA